MRVFICSPFRASASRTEEENKKNATWMAKHAIERGYYPFIPHLLYTQFLDESSEQQRNSGIKAGLAFLDVCAEMWILVPPEGLTAGMRAEYEHALEHRPDMTYKVFGLRADGTIDLPINDFGVS